MQISARTRYALIGLVIGLGCAGFIIVRLREAAEPLPTTFELANTTAAVVNVERLVVGDKVVASGVTILADAPGQKPQVFVSDPEPLPPGRPIELFAQVSGRPAAVSCVLEPRPQGSCVVRAVLGSGDSLRCTYTCQPLAQQ